MRRWLVLLGGQTEHSALLDMTPKSDRIELVVAHIRENLRNLLSIEELAAVANLSPRQFSRAFLAETGQTPAKAVERLRLEHDGGGPALGKIGRAGNGFCGPRTHASCLPADLRRARGGVAEKCSTGGSRGRLTSAQATGRHQDYCLRSHSRRRQSASGNDSCLRKRDARIRPVSR